MMKKLRAKFVSIRDLLATAWPIVLITAVGFVVAYQFVEPAPPRHMTITTGSESGAYYAYARRYAELLAANGIKLEVKTSAGSLQNLERLNKGEAEIAFVQGGIKEVVNDENGRGSDLRSLGSVAFEPVWVFYRSDIRIDKLFQLDGQRIAVGEEGSGIRGLALQLLEANEIKANSKSLLPVAGLNAAEALQRGEIDAAFIVAAPEAPVVQVLLRSPGVRVMSFSQADAYLRRFPFLSKIVLPRGVVDLVRDTPPRDTVLLATTANVIVRDNLHPALVSLMLQAMTEVHGKSGFFQRAGEFPAYKDRSFALSDQAQRFYNSGPPFLQRYLPFWIAVLVERLFVLILPIIILLFPLLKVAPSIYNWRVRSKIFRCYGDLKFLENEVRNSYDSSRHAEYLARLDGIEEDAYSRNIPLAFSDLFYTLREHINLVRAELFQIESRAVPGKAR
ncbi:MAG: TAXI family TRAP transporter solute-binding subunit [Propionivibrio sp.]|uniref:TAXI family TRAP transporter solute-binding subunit n=1 Tax=Propionivibrio sp. TaxID=2212460 RepID=UPI001A3839CD|nr:TAXI family TRAP transporter solute-binding subunit [Propionivibrio sp.]MBL8413964.1 TAXI family TRAP transporter solute-binding subunit [Propionivibrio sp.]